MTARPDGLFLLAAALIVGWQILVPPMVGLADNGDFPRVMSRFNIERARGEGWR